MYAKMESLLGNFSFISLFVAMLFFWVYASFFLQKKDSFINSTAMQQSNEQQAIESINIKKKENFWFLFGNIGMLLSNLTLLFLLLFRWKESGHFPLSNLYESLIFLSWSCTLIHFALFYITSQEMKTSSTFGQSPNEFRNKLFFIFQLISGNDLYINQEKDKNNKLTTFTKLAGCITSPCALFTNAFASFSLPEEMQKMAPLVPALQSNWLMMHVTVMIISYSALVLYYQSLFWLLLKVKKFIPHQLQLPTGTVFSKVLLQIQHPL
jgi:ABC-type transport system involved in cytochrome c biogenesis permease subunit